MKEKPTTVDEIYSWAYVTASKIIENVEDEGIELIRRLIFAIRGEETPGRFLDKLTTTLVEYRTNKAYELQVTIPKLLLTKELIGDSFHYVRAAILAGLLDAMSVQSSKEAGEKS
jgi:hypothetical protein